MENSPLYTLSIQKIRFFYNYLILNYIICDNIDNENKISGCDGLLFNNHFNYISVIKNIHLLCDIYELNLVELLEKYKLINSYNNNISENKKKIYNLLNNKITKDCEICYISDNCYKYWSCEHYICDNCYKAWHKSCPYCRNKNININELPKEGNYYLYNIKGYNLSYLIIIQKEREDSYIYDYTGYYISSHNIKKKDLKFELDYDLIYNTNNILTCSELYSILLKNKDNFIKVDIRKINILLY